MSKKNSGKKSNGGGLKSIRGGKDHTYGVSTGNHSDNDSHSESSENIGNTRTTEDAEHPTAFSPSKIIDFSTVRAQRNLDNRRNFERHFLQHIVDVYCEIDGGHELLPVEVVEVSESGCSFRMPTAFGERLPRDTTGAITPLQLRFYLSQDSFMRVGLFVINANRDIGTGGTQSMRYGCRIDESFASSEAYRQFVRFMEQFTRHAHRNSKQASGQ